MATLLLTAVGTAIGGPLGGALGAFIGQQADRSIFGAGSREGPRLKELSVTTSSYGQPIGRHFGRMRVAGSVIWATDLLENSSSQGGKGQPKTTTYSYSANFAVALSSTPIQRLGRIWADGNLLRGSGGDLKASGELRIYLGNGDAAVDPLIAADKGPEAPAFRDCAYVVFENLGLTDFGNRIPALTFEVFARDDDRVSLSEIVPGSIETGEDGLLRNTRGFSDEGGPLSATLGTIEGVYPLICVTSAKGLQLRAAANAPGAIVTLPDRLADDDGAGSDDHYKTRAKGVQSQPLALRYYDEDRDYQPGVQRAIGRRPNGQELIVDLPATMTASGAKAVVNENANRARWRDETLVWRISELDPLVRPGSLVRVPRSDGIWRVKSWEWNDQGIELGLERFVQGAGSQTGADTGIPTPPLDQTNGPTHLEFFELPPENANNMASPALFAAASSQSPAWNGAALFAEQGDALLPIGSTGARRAVIGVLSGPLGPSPSMVFEPEAGLDVHVIADDLMFAGTDILGISAGANRLLVGEEILQFHTATPLGNGNWRLRGLLRGRAGSEAKALAGHAVQTRVVLLNEDIVDLTGSAAQSSPSQRIAAIGRGDEMAVYASLRNSGASRRPLSPVHPRIRELGDTSLEICWTRRARGQWAWDYHGDVPLVEETERYIVGYGAIEAPLSALETNEPRIIISQAQRAELVDLHGAADLWVYQVGTYARSAALWLAHFN